MGAYPWDRNSRVGFMAGVRRCSKKRMRKDARRPPLTFRGLPCPHQGRDGRGGREPRLIKSSSDDQPWPHSFAATQLFTEESMATHSSILAWRIPWTEEPGGLQSAGLQRVRHDLEHTHCAVGQICQGSASDILTTASQR